MRFSPTRHLPPHRLPVRRLPLLLVVVAVALAGLGAHFTVRAENLRTSESARNRALVDVEATAEVRASVTRTLNAVLTYSHDDLAPTRRAADDLLRGRAGTEYRQLFARVSERAPDQNLTVTTRVVDSAVLSLTGRRATVLVFADQVARRGEAEPGTAAAQLLVTAVREGEGWVVTELRPR